MNLNAGSGQTLIMTNKKKDSEPIKIPRKGENNMFATIPATNEGVLSLRLPKGQYTIDASYDGHKGSTSVELQNNKNVKVGVR